MIRAIRLPIRLLKLDTQNFHPIQFGEFPMMWDGDMDEDEEYYLELYEKKYQSTMTSNDNITFTQSTHIERCEQRYQELEREVEQLQNWQKTSCRTCKFAISQEDHYGYFCTEPLIQGIDAPQKCADTSEVGRPFKLCGKEKHFYKPRNPRDLTKPLAIALLSTIATIACTITIGITHSIHWTAGVIPCVLIAAAYWTVYFSKKSLYQPDNQVPIHMMGD